MAFAETKFKQDALKNGFCIYSSYIVAFYICFSKIFLIYRIAS